MSIQVTIDGYPVEVKQWRFPCGEAGFKLLEGGCGPCNVQADITLKWEGNDDLMALGQAVDALRQIGVEYIELDIPYFPYSRQDRRCHEGEGHALKVVASYINSLKFDRIRTQDAHSYVLEALVDRLIVIPQHACAANLPKHDILIAPDAGAAKKIYDHRQVQQGTKVIVADKTRHTGGAVTTTLPLAHLAADKKVCVVDDLCDGGATFLALAEVLFHDCYVATQSGPKELNLYVTHGFFTKGVDELLKRYDNIFVHNLMAQFTNRDMYPNLKEI